MGGFADSSRSSSSACSRAESTSLRVDTRCCASTTRQGSAASGPILELPADCVQILDDIDQPLRRADALGRDAAEVAIERGEPLARLHLVATHQRVETAEEADEEEGQ